MRTCRRNTWYWWFWILILTNWSKAGTGEEPASMAMIVFSVSQRRLLGFQWADTVPDPNDLTNDATKLVQDMGDVISGAAVMSFDLVKKNFQEASTLLEEGHQVVTAAWIASIQFSSYLKDIYDHFQPLESVFRATHGLIPLLTHQEKLQRVVQVLFKLLNCTNEVEKIGGAIGSITDIFSRLNSLFNQELGKLEGGGGRRLQYYTSLLDGLEFDGVTANMNEFAVEAKKFGETLEAIKDVLEPLLEESASNLAGRRLLVDKDKIVRDQWKYEGAVRGIIPTWQSTEDMVWSACGQTNVALQAVANLECRIKGFASQSNILAMDAIKSLISDCNRDAALESNKSECPVASHSAGIRDMLSNNAGTIGWLALSFKYAIVHSMITRIIFAILIILIGIIVGFFGYRGKHCTFWFEGFLAGIVVWTTVIAIIVCWFGVCRGGFIHTCDPTWIIVVVMIFSVGCAFLSCKTPKFQMFTSGFDLGAVLAGVYYMIMYRCEVFDAFLDAETARAVISGLLASTLLTGLLFSVLTVYFSKIMIVSATSAVGAVLIIFAIYLIFNHKFSWPDIVAIIFVWGIAIVVQYKVTAKDLSDEKRISSKDPADGESSSGGME